MADYTVRIVAETEEADKKVKKLDREVTRVTEARKLDISFPSFDDVIQNIQTLGRVLKQTWEIAGKLPILGGRINDLQEVGDIALETLGKIKNALLAIPKLTPGNILQGAFTGAVRGADELSKRIANLGFTIFGVTQSIGVLKGAFGSFFNDTIGREIRLQESLLRTKTTLASTADVAINGKRIADPLEAIVKLEKPIEDTLQNIRVRSLDIAGTTSDAIVQVFGVVASQIGNIGGGLKEAEDLAITFSAALGTLGLSDPNYATQEIRSILTGTIDQNSVLARSLGLTNEEVAKAKNSAEGLVEFLKRRLGAFTAGQSLAAKGFAGITSNIEEFSQEVKRSFGKGMLDPLLEGLTVLYERLQLIFKPALGIADAFGRAAGALGKGVLGAAAAAPTLQGFTQRTQKQTFERGEQYSVEALVKTQKYIDDLRPAIAGLVDQIAKAVAQLASGLKVLAEGFITFKAEQIEVYIRAFTGLTQLLNSTVIPAFTNLMKVYGEILKLPLTQWINAAAIDFGLLERVGIMPLTRTLFALSKSFGGALSLFQQVGAGIQWLTRQIAGLATAFIVLLSKAVEFATSTIRKLGQGLVWMATQGVVAVLGALRALAVQIQVLLVQLAEFAAAAGPRLATLAPAIADVAKAFGSIDRALGKAQGSVGQFALKAAAALDQVEAKAKDVQAGIVSVGQKIQGAVTGVGKGIQGMVMGWVKGMAIFFAEMFLVQMLILGIYELVTKIQKKNQEISDQTRAELAVKRLSTIYADLGENASAAAKAMQEIEKSIVTNRIDALKKSVGELSDKMREIRQMNEDRNGFTRFFKTTAAMLNPTNFDVKPQSTGFGTQEKFGDALIRTRGEELRNRIKQLQNLANFQSKQDASNKANEDVRVLAKERIALEKELKDLRKEINKELSDLEWNEKQKVLQIEQQMKEALFQKERSAMEERQRQENQNLGAIGQQYATLLDEYEKGIFDAQVNSQKRQFDFATRQAELEKQVGDYRYRLEQQTLKLREKMGDMSKKITDYESAEKIRTAKEVLNYALKAAAKQGEDFVVTPEEIRDFNNAAASAGVSATRVLTMLKLGAGRGLGISSATPPDQIMNAMKENFPILKASDSAFVAAANARGKALQGLGQSQGGSFAYQQALDELGNRRFLKSAPPTTPPKMGDLSQYLNPDRESARMSAALTQTLNKAQEFIRLQNSLDVNKPLEDFRRSLDNPNFWKIQSIGELDEQIKLSASNMKLLNAALDQGAIPSQLESMQNSMKTLLSILYDATFDKAASAIQRSKKDAPEIKQQKLDKLTQFMDNLRTLAPEDAIKTLEAIKGQPLAARLKETLASFVKFFNQLPQIASQLTVISADAVKASIAEARQQATNLSPEIIEAYGRFTELLKSMIPGGYSLSKANASSDLDAQQLVRGQLLSADASVLQDPQQVAAILAEGEKLRLQYQKANEILHPLRAALENFETRVRLAASAAEIYASASRRLVEDFLSGSTDFRQAMANFSQTIGQGFIQQFLDIAMAPMKEQVFERMKKLFGVQSAEDKAKLAMNALAASQTTLGEKTDQLKDAVSNLTNALTAPAAGVGGPDLDARTSGLPYGYAIGQTVGTSVAPLAQTGPISLPVTPFGGTTADSLQAMLNDPTQGIAAVEKTLEQSFAGIGDTLTHLGTTAAETAQGANTAATEGEKGFTKFLGGMMGVATGALSIAGGIQQMQEGGTSNTLAGIGSILLGIGGAIGGLGSMGLFGKKAGGGAVSANRPYLVGEAGPELVVPGSSGTVVPHNQLREAMNTRAGGATAAQLNMTFQTTSIGGVEYVSREQLEAAMASTRRAAVRDGARQGMSMTIDKLRQSPGTRSRVGLS